MSVLLKEDGDKLLLESGGRITTKATIITPTNAIRGNDYEFYINSEDGDYDGTTVVTFSGTGITINSTATLTANRVRVRTTIDIGAALGSRDITITTTGVGTESIVAGVTIADICDSDTLRGGFQYTLLTRGSDIRRQPGITVHDILNNQANTCSFRVDGRSNVPVAGEKIEIVDSALYGHPKLVKELGASGHWRLGESVGQPAAQEEINDNDGNYNNVQLGVAGALADGNTAARFNGSAYVTAGNVAAYAFTGPFSVSFFAKFLPQGSNTVLVSKADSSGRGWLAYLNTDRFAFEAHDSGGGTLWNFTTVGTYADDVFRHIVVTWDGKATTPSADGAKIYVNGVLTASVAPNGGTPAANAEPFVIGAYTSGFITPFIGDEDEVSVYPRELSASEVMQLYVSRIVIERNAGRLFTGTVQSIHQIYEDSPTIPSFDTQCSDFTWLLNKFRPVGVYKNISVSLIVKDLVTRFAPGFSHAFVQTNLAKISATFDGTQDFSTCLNQLAEAIGGGHWYVDYDQVLHFFHIQPLGVEIPNPEIPQGTVGVPVGAPQTPMTVAVGPVYSAPHSHTPGYFAFRMNYVYDNGVNSALGPWSNIIILNGRTRVSFSNVETGLPAGTHNVVKRRIWYTVFTGVGYSPLEKFIELQDNVANSFIIGLGGQLNGEPSDIMLLKDIPATSVIPGIPLVAPPAGSTETPIAELGITPIFWLPDPPFGVNDSIHVEFGFTPTWYSLRTVNMYRDGTFSLPSPPSDPIHLDGVHSVRLRNIGIGPTINNIEVIARLVYASGARIVAKTLSQVVAELQASHTAGTLSEDYAWIIGVDDAATLQALSSVPRTYETLAAVIGLSDLDNLLSGGVLAPDWSPPTTSHWIVIPDNTTIDAFVQPGIAGPILNTNQNESNSEVPQWPNPDGPDLEETLPQPEVVTDGSLFLLKDPQFTKNVDISQLRNRIFVRGAGSALTAGAGIGSTELKLAELNLFSLGGGTVSVGLQSLQYNGLSARSGPGSMFLTSPLQVALNEGDSINLFQRFDNLESQKSLGRVELDKDGNQTDGVHEYTIVDTQLTTPFQIYQRGQAELELFSWPIITINYATRDSKSRSGARVSVDMLNPPVKGTFLIQEVTIDQIHDESDQLMPRYTVRASSVKFDLSDLLLKIIGANQVGTGTSYAGISTPAEPFTPTLGFDPESSNLAWAGIRVSSGSPVSATAAMTLGTTGTAPVLDATEIPAFGLSASTSRSHGAWATGIAATAGTASGYNASMGAQIESNFHAVWFIKTPKDLTNLILWVGFNQVGSIPLSDTPTNQAALSFRFSSGTDQGWVGILQPVGVSHPKTTVSLGAIAADTYYKLEMITKAGIHPRQSIDAEVTFVVNGVSRSITFGETAEPGASPDHNMPISDSAYVGISGLLMVIGVAAKSGGTNRKISFKRFIFSSN